MTKTCRWCKREKPLDEFYEDPKNKRKYVAFCKQCSNARSKKYYLQNKEKVLAQHLLWIKTNRRKLKIYERQRYLRDREKILARKAAQRAARRVQNEPTTQSSN